MLVALPSIEADLDFSEQGLQWVLSAYALAFGGPLLLGGRLLALNEGFQAAFVAFVGLAGIGLALALLLPGRPRNA